MQCAIPVNKATAPSFARRERFLYDLVKDIFYIAAQNSGKPNKVFDLHFADVLLELFVRMSLHTSNFG